ncbi:MAG: helix-turn-helix transcriptional regulator [Eubacterium sp.]|nr:helix-turn-helix transcriptional regulator [Eubacterium sp.]
MCFGKNLQFLRKMKGMTQEELAAKLNVSRQTISKWENDSAYPETETLIGLCALFSCSLDQMLREDMNSLDEAYSEISTVTVEPMRYIRYAVISGDPEADAITHVEGWAKRLNIENPLIIGWDFPNVSQEQINVFNMHGYVAALVLEDGQDIGDIETEIISQEKQKYITITIKEPFDSPFTLIPNAYKTLMTHMSMNGIKGKCASNIIPCYEKEYVADGVTYMDIFIAIE